MESCTLSFTGSSILPSGVSNRAASTSFSSWRRIAVLPSSSNLRDLEVGRQRDHQHVDLLLGRTDRLRVGAVQRHAFGIERIPHGRVGVSRAQRVRVEAGDALHVGQRRHVHDRHAGHARPGHRIEQLAHTGRAVLRLLHAQAHQVVVLGVDASGAARRHLAGQLPGVQHHGLGAAAHRQAHAEALGVDQIGLGRQAHQMDGMPAEQQLGGEQRTVGCAQQ